MTTGGVHAGVDVGSRATKVVLWDPERRVMLAGGSVDQGVDQRRLASGLLDRLLSEQGLTRENVTRAVATGYGRRLVDFADAEVTEITCQARGVRHLAPSARTVFEIGGQDSKCLRLDASGGVRDFAMNDRCAAGTGRFLEMVSVRLGVSLEELGGLAASSTAPVTVNGMCVVFAETEIVGWLAAGRSPADIAAGVQAAVAARVAALACGNVEAPVFLSGGVALVRGMAEALGRAAGCEVQTAPHALLTGALGAALLAGGFAPRRATASPEALPRPGS